MVRQKWFLVTFVAWFSFRLAHLALQNVSKGYVIFLYLRDFVAKSDQKPKTKNGMNEKLENFWPHCEVQKKEKGKVRKK